jgi:biopolymer transport protein ExbB
MKSILLQVVSELPEQAAELSEELVPQENLMDLAMKGGIILIPIIILFAIAIYLLVERYLTIKKASKLEEDFMSNIKDMVLNDNLAGALKLCDKTNTPISNMIAKGLSRVGKPLKSIEVAIENVGKLELYKLERGLPFMATIAGAAPMIGFLGTVTGMITALKDLASKGDTINAGSLSVGIYEAMVTTVAGLIVGIFAYISFNILTTMIEKVVYRMEASSVDFFDILQTPSKN